jgi:hypothetical protein
MATYVHEPFLDDSGVWLAESAVGVAWTAPLVSHQMRWHD